MFTVLIGESLKKKKNYTFKKNFQLKKFPSFAKNGLTKFIQGGDFSDDGLSLFILNGRVINPKKKRDYKGFDINNTGIWTFENINNSYGNYVTKSSLSSTFKYQYNPYKFEEPEGLTYWDLDKDERNPGKSGQIHAILLAHIPRQKIYLKHYRIEYEEK